ncbi:PREDICTED: coiled-coil domain-containing protein 147-like [Acromyrmex echinatior]|uniref:coiled-coil domain-containing protein 147-like n=1 Tax=Acromyrmex echinatior TaxID=103372 RepID=UPI000580D22E|nr:PREDICTED: coiled-coil domain-containing protein 147-like [Acromyrmex echinatior]
MSATSAISTTCSSKTGTSQENFQYEGQAINEDDNVMYDLETIPRLYDQAALNDSVRDLDLSKEKAELLDSGNKAELMKRYLDAGGDDMDAVEQYEESDEHIEKTYTLAEDGQRHTVQAPVANASVEASANNITRLESLIKDQKIMDEKLRKEISKLMLKKMNLQTDFDNAIAEIEKLEKEISERGKKIKDIKNELNRSKEDIAKYKHEKDLIDKRLLKTESEQSKLKRELKQTLINFKNVENDAQTCHKEQIEDKQRIKNLLREKNNIALSKETAYERIKQLDHELSLCGHGKKRIEHELDTLTQTINDMKTQIEAVEKERDRCSTTAQGLEQKLESQISETKQKHVEILDYKKRLDDAEIKYRQHQSLFEAVRAERNLCNRNLIETQEEVQDLKSKLKITSQQTEQLKEDIAMKEANLVKKEFLLRKVEKEKEDLKIDLQTSHTEISNLRQQIEEAKKEEKNLRQNIQQADLDIKRQKKDIDNVMNERDILGSQLVRRNDELSLQYSRMKVLNRTLQCGEKQYNQRLEDIRLLKFERFASRSFLSKS